MKLHPNIKDKDHTLLLNFNNREYDAFEKVYELYYKELYYYTFSLFKDTNTDAEDILQDVFLNIWENKKLFFDSLGGIKGYILVAIKSKFLMYYRHKKFVDKVNADIIKDEKFFILQAAEAEILSIVPDILKLLPEECAKIMKLLFEGYDIKEIAEKLGKKQSTVYNQRNTAISILKNKLPKDKLLIMFLLIN